MCRRLWWSLVIFDNRICEMSDHKTTILTPSWDCKTPLNINDFDILPEMRHLPVAHQQPTESLFIVVRSQLSDFVRHSAFHLDFTNPSLKSIAEPRFSNSLDSLEKTMEAEYLKFCNPENPVHFMIIWTTRGCLARYRLIDHLSKHHQSVDTTVSFALRILECDTKLMTSPLTKRYLWLIRLHFPFPAYVHLLQDLKRRPLEHHAGQRWEVISINYKAHFADLGSHTNPLFKIFSQVVLQAWGVYKDRKQLDESKHTPWIVSDIQRRAEKIRLESEGSSGISSMPLMTDVGGDNANHGVDWQFPGDAGHGSYSDVLGQVPLELDVSQLDWNTIDWNPMYT